MSLDVTAGEAVVLRRWPRRVAVGSATVAGVTLAVTAAGGWYYAGELLLVRPDPPEYPIEVLGVDGSRVTLAGEGADEPGLLGVNWAGGYARVGDDVRVVGGQVVRSLLAHPDLPAPGTRVRLEGYAAPADLTAFRQVSGLDVEDVHYDGPLGRYPATVIAQPAGSSGDRWIVHVHGRGGNRAEGYRLVPALHRLGYPQLAISYRNDEGAPAGARRVYGLGWTEAADLAAAIDYARSRGARDVVLVGYSMGGAIVGNYLRTVGSDDVAGVLYDSPALSWPGILAFHARDRGLPAFSGAVASTAVRLRAGISVWSMDQVARAAELDVPVLLVHGAGDSTVPVVSSDAFAAARPDLVTYLRTEAEHVRSWNRDPAGYEAAVATFLASLG